MARPRGAEKPTHAVIEFKDTGHGLTEEQCKRAFTSLLRTTKSTGSGLGLAIAHHHARRMGGDLTVCRVPMSGLRFELVIPVTLPLHEGDDPEKREVDDGDVTDNRESRNL